MKIASLVDNIAMSQCNYEMIRSFNKLVSCDCCVSCFFLNIAPIPLNTNFSVINSYYLSAWNGMVISTSIQSAAVLRKINNSKKFLYLYDMEWLRYPSDYKQNLDILRDPNLKLLSRNEDHAKLIKNYCGIQPDILQDWNINKLRELWIN
jgi:hypothetical protein